MESPEGLKIYNRHGEELFVTETMETYPQPLVEHGSLATNNDII